MPNRMRSRGGKRGYLKGKKYPGRTQTALTFRSPEGYLPQKFVTQHVYQQDTYVDINTPGTGALSFQVNLINIDRPEPTGVNQRVNGFDQMNLLYKQWRVNYCHITMKFLNMMNEPLLVITVPRPDDVGFVVGTDTSAGIAQQPYARNRLLGTADGGRPMGIFTYGCNPSALFGRNIITSDAGVHSGIDTTGPSSNMRFNIWFENPTDPSAGDLEVSYTLLVKYYVTWWDRKISTGSSPAEMVMLKELTGGITIKEGKEEMDEDAASRTEQFIGPASVRKPLPQASAETNAYLANLCVMQHKQMSFKISKV